MIFRITRLVICCLVSLIIFPLAANAEENSKKLNLSLGLGVGMMSSEYKQTDARALPVPAVHYEGERFFVRGLSGGVHLFKNDVHEFSANLSYMPQSFDASRSDNWAMRQLKDRNSTLLAGVSYKLKTQWGIAKIGVGADILGKSDGVVVDAAYAYPFAAGSVTLVPSAGVLWASSQHNDYYYGVSAKEARASGLKEYDAKSSFSPYLGFDAQIPLAENWNVYMNARAIFLGDEVTDSPMVDKDIKYGGSVGITYSF